MKVSANIFIKLNKKVALMKSYNLKILRIEYCGEKISSIRSINSRQKDGILTIIQHDKQKTGLLHKHKTGTLKT